MLKKKKSHILGFWSIWIGNCPQEYEIQGHDYDIGAVGFLRASLVLWGSSKDAALDQRSASYGALWLSIIDTILWVIIIL